MLRCVPSMPTFLRVSLSLFFFNFKNGCSILAKAFSAFIEIIVGFLVNLLVYCITSVDLQILKNP